MKKILLILIIFSFTLNGAAQAVSDTAQPPTSTVKATAKKARNMSLGFSAGYSMVFGKYGAVDPQDKNSGFASGGWLAQVAFDWMGKNRFGLELQYIFQQNPLKDSAENVYPSGQSYTLGSGSWNNHYLLIGPVFMTDFNRLRIHARLLGGIIYSFSSHFNTTDPYSGNNNHNQGAGFAMQLGAGVGYVVSKVVTLRFNLDFIAGWPGKERQYASQFLRWDEHIDPKTGQVVYEPVYSAPVEYVIKKVVTTLNPSVGVVFKF